MKVVVQGLWHLGLVTAACMSEAGYEVVGIDDDPLVVSELRNGKPSISEPGLTELICKSTVTGKLQFTTNYRDALEGSLVLWVAFDTPVNDSDEADCDFVHSRVIELMPFITKGTLIIISSQLPVGSVARLEDYALKFWPQKELIFACIPENLRLGQALKVFKEPDRLIAGVRSNETKNIIQALMSPFDMKIEWMSIESAEMTKHSINAFLAASITFANEIALICEKVGADAIEVARGLKTESRIGPAAYLSPGAPYAGGTLARDIKFLSDIGLEKKISIPVLSSVQKSNDEHKKWIQNKLRELFPEFKKLTVALWGLTYKPGTDTLRRSLSVELCEWLTSSGVDVRVFDPVINNLPQDLIDMHVVNCQDALDAVKSSNVLVIGTNWPQFIQDASFLKSTQTRDLIVIDATGFLREVLIDASIKYISVGHLQLRKLRNDE